MPAPYAIGDSVTVTATGENWIVVHLSGGWGAGTRLQLRQRWSDTASREHSPLLEVLESEVVDGPTLAAPQVGDSVVINGQSGSITSIDADGTLVIETLRPHRIRDKYTLPDWQFRLQPYFVQLGAHP